MPSSEAETATLTATSYRSKLTAAAAGLLRRAGGRRGAAASSPRKPDPMQQEEAYLAMREEWLRSKAQERATQDKVTQLTAQLARTEEAAKRILTRSDPAARGGVAQRLLDLERDNGGLRAERAELVSQLEKVQQAADNSKRQAADLRQRLDAALADQRRLALQVGRLEAAGRGTRAGSSPVRRRPGDGSRAAEASEQGGADEGVAVAAQVLADAEASADSAVRHAAALRQQLSVQEGVVQRQATEIRALQALLTHQQDAAAEAVAEAARERSCCTTNSDDWGGSEAAAALGAGQPGLSHLKLKYLKAKSALDGATAANTRLLRELEEARAQVAVLLERQAQAAAHAQAQAEQLAAARLAAGGGGAGKENAPCSSRRGGTRPGEEGAGASASEGLCLRQQLAEARHHAAQLSIELEAAQAKLAIYQAHAFLLDGASGGIHDDASLADSDGCAIRASWPEAEEEHTPAAVAAQRLATRRRLLPAGPGQQHAPTAAPMAPVRPPLPGLAPGQNIVELQLHGAQLLHPSAAGPCGLTFLSADAFAHDTQLTNLGEGPNPVYATTLQFVVTEGAALRAHCAAESIRLELHACRAAAPLPAGMEAEAGAEPRLDYEQVAAGSIPLACLVQRGQQGRGDDSQECRLLAPSSKAGVAVVTYSLRVLRPLV